MENSKFYLCSVVTLLLMSSVVGENFKFEHAYKLVVPLSRDLQSISGYGQWNHKIPSEPNPQEPPASSDEIKRLVPSGPNPAESPDIAPSKKLSRYDQWKHKIPSSRTIPQELPASSDENKRQVPTGPNPAQSPEKYLLRRKKPSVVW